MEVLVYIEQLKECTSVPEALLLAFFPHLSHILSMNVTITQGALQDTAGRLGEER